MRGHVLPKANPRFSQAYALGLGLLLFVALSCSERQPVHLLIPSLTLHTVENDKPVPAGTLVFPSEVTLLKTDLRWLDPWSQIEYQGMRYWVQAGALSTVAPTFRSVLKRCILENAPATAWIEAAFKLNPTLDEIKAIEEDRIFKPLRETILERAVEDFPNEPWVLFRLLPPRNQKSPVDLTLHLRLLQLADHSEERLKEVLGYVTKPAARVTLLESFLLKHPHHLESLIHMSTALHKLHEASKRQAIEERIAEVTGAVASIETIKANIKQAHETQNQRLQLRWLQALLRQLPKEEPYRTQLLELYGSGPDLPASDRKLWLDTLSQADPTNPHLLGRYLDSDFYRHDETEHQVRWAALVRAVAEDIAQKDMPQRAMQARAKAQGPSSLAGLVPGPRPNKTLYTAREIEELSDPLELWAVLFDRLHPAEPYALREAARSYPGNLLLRARFDAFSQLALDDTHPELTVPPDGVLTDKSAPPKEASKCDTYLAQATHRILVAFDYYAYTGIEYFIDDHGEDEEPHKNPAQVEQELRRELHAIAKNLVNTGYAHCNLLGQTDAYYLGSVTGGHIGQLCFLASKNSPEVIMLTQPAKACRLAPSTDEVLVDIENPSSEASDSTSRVTRYQIRESAFNVMVP